MICVETIGKIRRWHRVDKLSISAIARRLSASRNTVAKYLEGEVTQPRYKTRLVGEAGGDADGGCNTLAQGATHGQAVA